MSDTAARPRLEFHPVKCAGALRGRVRLAAVVELDAGGIGSFENGAGVVGPSGMVVSEKAIPVAELPTAETCRITGLSEEQAPAMLARGFGLPFLAPEGAAEVLWRFATQLPATRLTRGGQFWHLSGDHGKEDAIELLCRNGLVSRPMEAIR